LGSDFGFHSNFDTSGRFTDSVVASGSHATSARLARETSGAIVTPGDGHKEIFLGLLEKLGTAGNLTTDAHLAALAIEYQAEIASTDNDFARFKGLRWFNPIRV